MTLRVAINGFGRMGKLVLRAGWDNPELEFVHINEPKGGADCAAHLLEFDTVHGTWGHEISSTPESITIDGKRLSYSEETSPEAVDWAALGIDLLLECSGKYRTDELLQPFLDAGIKKVLVACPVKTEGALNIVYGVNEHLYDADTHNIITAASCTTNCIAPAIKVLHEKIGIERGSFTTIHDLTNTQVIVDSPHKDLRRARSGVNSLVPTTTGSATAVAVIYPELKGKLDGHAVRVPLLTGSLTDFCFEMKREITAEEVNALFEEAANGELKDILGFEKRPLVSTDFTTDARSVIIDGPSTIVVDGTHLKVYLWYDNEWGYVSRMIDIAQMISEKT
ncbi:Glyceraldehyde-3-phosphate dehydrogenase 3 [Candidatus Terasakiella magnetica]|uniref:Glyceraldehyde-3-phosphate dehydrogenase n=1 Tax=Candidatus Terasakiella magnetica TaxID=1867952 RepID=A0A1C3RF14_9PROT|nr:ArsJ-associated glyceraldehyde-3-phosphate dehydrogenase [Candidatus Terasakiella magnetica]SCA55848.1 Glyceraldehyde-3-phosphate dehydrogenase 3 [Candidatus Terasakiella magnetica]